MTGSTLTPPEVVDHHLDDAVDHEVVRPSEVSPWPAPPPALRRPAPRQRGRATRLAALLATAAIAGGAAGWVAGTTSSGGTAGTAVGSRLAADGLDVTGVLAVAEPSIASIDTTLTYRQGPFTQQGQGAGTGIVLTSDGYLLTNAHVVAGADSITVTLPGSDAAYAATVVGTDTEADVAVIKIDATGLTPATFADSTEVVVGDDVVDIGNALDLGETMSVTRGIVSALDRTITTSEGTLDGLIQTDAAISSGDSGGALLDAQGRVLGMNVAGAVSSSGVSAENIGFVIPSATLLRVVAGFGVSV